MTITDKKLIDALRRMAPETGSLICLGCGYERRCYVHGCAVLRAAVGRLEELTAPQPNDPLTLEQLREMDGEPVWCESEHRPDGSGWFLVDASALQPHEFIAIGRERGIPCAGIDTGYWLAYRHKPEEGTA